MTLPIHPLPVEPLSPLHFIGIGGSGMFPLAELAKANSFDVTGSDTTTSASIRRLEDLGIDVLIGHHAEQIAPARTIIVSSAIDPNNSELLEARKLDKLVLHRSDLLAWFISRQQGITISGTHGKTTTTAMISFVLRALGKDPSYAIGGKITGDHSSSRKGYGINFIAEADESDGTFLKYQPFVGVVTNIDRDHLEHYKTKKNIIRAFQVHASNISQDGACIASAQAYPYLCDHHPRIVTYGLKRSCHIAGSAISVHEGVTRFKLKFDGTQRNVHLKIFGHHNVENALACLATCYALGFDMDQAVSAIADFPGVDRRLTLIGHSDLLLVYDDYAHNPGKISSVVRATREAWPNHKIVVAFQGHRYQRVKTLYNGFTRSFKDADKVFVVPIYGVGKENCDPNLSPSKLAQDIHMRSRCEAIPCDSFAEVVDIMGRVVEKTVFLTVGAGDIYKLAWQVRDACI